MDYFLKNIFIAVDRWHLHRRAKGLESGTGLQVRRVPAEPRPVRAGQHDDRLRHPARAARGQLPHLQKR